MATRAGVMDTWRFVALTCRPLRPTVTGMKTRTEDIRMRVTDEEKRLIERAAQKDGITTSAWLRALALRTIKNGGR